MRKRAGLVPSLAALFLVAPAAAVPPDPPLAVREAVPGRLRVRVFHKEKAYPGAPGPVWIFATAGFRAVAQKEMLFIVVRRPAEAPMAFPEDPLRFFASMFPLAAGGQPAAEGGFTTFAGPKFLGRDDIRGMTFTRLDPFRSAFLQDDALLLVPLTGPELDAVKRFGALRILGLLGQQARVYPWPSFFDRGRPGVVPAHAEWRSVLDTSSLVSLPGVRVTAEYPPSMMPLVGQGNLLVSLPLTGRAAIEEVVRREGAPVALAAELDPQADALAVYPPGSNAASVFRLGDGSVTRLSGTFVMFLPSTGGDVARPREDGFTVLLSEASRRAFYESLRDGRDLELLGTPESMTIRIRWRD